MSVTSSDNEMGGTVGGSLLQTGTVQGDVHFHHADREVDRVTPQQLPHAFQYFVGRTAELSRLTAMLDDAAEGGAHTLVISAISGTAGVGKPIPGDVTHFVEGCRHMLTTTDPVDNVAILYFRLSDLRNDDTGVEDPNAAFAGRIAQVRKHAEQNLGWKVGKIIIENDVIAKEGKGKSGRRRPASAFKRRKVVLPNGKTAYRVYRPGFRDMLDLLDRGVYNAVVVEDGDRLVRDPHDFEELVDVVEARRVNIRSMSGSLVMTDGGTDMEIGMARGYVNHANLSARDARRRSTKARARKAAAGEVGGGGLRPYGFEVDGVTRRPDEVLVIQTCIQRVIQIDGGAKKQTSLRTLARELNEAEVPTVTGVRWSAENLRAILLRPRNAGILVHQGRESGPAPWRSLVPEYSWRTAVAILTDPNRNCGPGAAPRWWGTGIIRCGRCDDGTTVDVTSGGREPRYKCREHAHLSRNAKHVDAFLRRCVIERLSRPDAVDLLPIDTGDEVDIVGLRAEAVRLRDTLNSMAEERALGLIDREQLAAGTAKARKRIAEINATLETVSAPSPLKAFVEAGDIEALWDASPLSLRRAVLESLFTVTILPSGRRGRGFDSSKVRVEPVVVHAEFGRTPKADGNDPLVDVA